MKLTLTQSEAATIIANSISPVAGNIVYSDEITILPAQAAVSLQDGEIANSRVTLSQASVYDALTELLRATERNPATGYKNKIGMIKAVRILTNLGLKESKDLVEAALPSF